jgi:hypothetical protein
MPMLKHTLCSVRCAVLARFAIMQRCGARRMKGQRARV